MPDRSSFIYLFLFLLLSVHSLILHWDKLSLDIAGIHATRQAQTQQNIQHFYRYDSNILNPATNVLNDKGEPKILRYEFPIMQWVIAMIFRVTGESILVTRVLMFLLGLLTVGGMYYWLKQIFTNQLVSFAGAWAFNFSPVFYYYTLNPIPDNLALCSSVWSMAFFFRFVKTQKKLHVFFAALFLSLAVAAKLPYIIFIAAPAAWFCWQLLNKRFKNVKPELQSIVLFLVMLAPTIVWYAWVIPSWNNGVVMGIFDNKISVVDTINLLRFHAKTMFPIRLMGYLAIPFFLVALYFMFRNKAWKDIRFLWLTAMALGVLAYWIFEFNMIGRVHDYYMMPFLLVLSVPVAYGIFQLLKGTRVSQTLTVLLLAGMPYVTYSLTNQDWSEAYAHHHQDVFKYKDELRAAVPEGAKCIILNDPTLYLFSYLVDKEGFVFYNDNLQGLWVKDMKARYDVRYIYSDSRKIDTDPTINQYFKTLLLERGSVRVYELK